MTHELHVPAWAGLTAMLARVKRHHWRIVGIGKGRDVWVRVRRR